MALPNGAGGYQVGDGNINEAVLFVQGAPTAVAAAATMTSAQLANGLFVFNGAAGNLTLPTVALVEADISSAQKVDAAFDFIIVNADASGSDAVTLAAGTGWTLVGTAAVSARAGAAGSPRRSEPRTAAMPLVVSEPRDEGAATAANSGGGDAASTGSAGVTRSTCVGAGAGADAWAGCTFCCCGCG